MHDASSHIDLESQLGLPIARRLAVVSPTGNAPVPTPEELVELLGCVARDRDRQAFGLLFRHFGPRLKSFFMRWTASSGAAEDLVQETMLNVWRRASYFDPARAGVATWMFTIARNVRIDHLRRQRDPTALPADTEDAPASVEDWLMGAERDARVRGALVALSTDQQTIIRLSYFSEKSQTEIAEELGIPLGTVKSRTRLAMSRLRALLEDET